MAKYTSNKSTTNVTETGGPLLEQHGMGYPAVAKQAYSPINYSLFDFDSTRVCPFDSTFVCPFDSTRVCLFDSTCVCPFDSTCLSL